MQERLTENYWVTNHNLLDEVMSEMKLPKKVDIYDVTLREGEQTPGVVLRPEEKIVIGKDLDDLGVSDIEIFPITSEGDQYALTELSKIVRYAKTRALCRIKPSDVDVAMKCGVYGATIEGPGNPKKAKYGLGFEEDEIISMFCKTIEHAKKLGLYVAAEPWDCGRADLAFLEKLFKAIAESGADEIAMADSYGGWTPWTTVYLYKKLRSWVGPYVKLATHFHNDFGMALANSLGAIIGGATVVHASMNGLGEKTGNTSTDELAVALELLLGVETGIKMEKLYPLSRKIEDITKNRINPNKPITGDRFYTMGSGLVLDMIARVEKNLPQSIWAIMPKLTGRPKYEIVYGKMVGTGAINKKLADMGIAASDEQVQQIVRIMKDEAMIRKAIIPEYVIENIIHEVLCQN